ncbi:hypothetical protein [Streptomyces cylindrosporus]|uniref:Secreted protein n=1 Tax=Streptomyces cylindrosporus TaxID=2927583 RepID=A0ABS9YNN5_9ACTN|nr:hypothetical protein [Streptomyces cylindrosporus]MCI3278868.1 hypothetical protein [Streptomyces cylindrosporus]
MRKRWQKVMWAGVAVAVVAVAVMVALVVHGLRNLGADDRVAPKPDAPKAGAPKAGAPKAGAPKAGAPKADAPKECLGTRPVGSLPAAADGSPLERVLARIDELARQQPYTAVFTGLSVDEDRRTADVWRIPSTAFDDEVCGSAVEGVTVRLHDTDVDRGTLDRLSDRIADDIRRWDGTFEMREVGVDERGFVHVGVDDPGTAGPIIEKAYGESDSRYIRVEYVGQAEPADAA